MTPDDVPQHIRDEQNESARQEARQVAAGRYTARLICEAGMAGQAPHYNVMGEWPLSADDKAKLGASSTGHFIVSDARRFTRTEVLAVLKSHLALSTARPPEMTERDALRALIIIFERME